MAGGHRQAWAYGIGAAGYAIGLAMSALFDLPSGAIIVCALVACGGAYALMRRSTAPA